MNYIPQFFGIKGGTGEYLVKYKLVLFCPQVAGGIWMDSISAGFFAFNSSVYGIFPFLFPRASILVGSTSNAVDDSLSPWNTNNSFTSCPNPFLPFVSSDPA